MATLVTTPIKTFLSGEIVTPASLNELGQSSVTLTAGTIVDADISASAAIAASKLAGTLDLSSKTVTLPDASVSQAKLAPGVAGRGPAFRAFANTPMTVPSGVITRITLDGENFDTNANFANNRFTPTVAGYYQINASVYTEDPTDRLICFIYKNNQEVARGSYTALGREYLSNVSDLVYMNGASDYLELFAVHGHSSIKIVWGGTVATFMSGFLARAA